MTSDYYEYHESKDSLMDDRTIDDMPIKCESCGAKETEPNEFLHIEEIGIHLCPDCESFILKAICERDDV